MQLKNKYILRPVSDKVVAIALEQGDQQTDNVITLNSTGAFIFGLVNDGAEKEEIVKKFFAEYNVTKSEAEEAINDFIENLSKAGLLAE